MNKEILSKEKEFYQNNFKNLIFMNLVRKKIQIPFKERDNVYLDYSYFGFYALSINNKCIFSLIILRIIFLNFLMLISYN